MEEAILLLSQNGQDRILGLTLLERLILYGRKAGLKKFWLYSEKTELLQQVLQKLRADRRFSPENLELAGLTPENFRMVFSQKDGRSPVLVLEDNLVLHPDFLAAVRADGQEQAEDMVQFCSNGSSSQHGSWSPGVFSVKRDKLGQLLPTLVRRRSISDSPAAADIPFSYRQVDIDSPFFTRVDSPETTRRAERQLLETGRKPTDGYITRVFFRPISLKLTSWLIKLGLTPNQISLVVLAVELLSVYLIFQGNYKSMALGGLLFLLSSVIDCCDGENARLTCRVSRFGTIFDISADAFLYVIFFTVLPIGLFRATANQLWLYTGAFGWLSMLSFYLQMIFYARRAGIGFNIVPIASEIEASINDPDFQTWADRLAARMAFIYRRDFFTVLACLLILVGAAKVLALMVAFFACLEAVYFGSWSRRQLKKKSSDRLQTA
ncbi:MAG: CDP-alcohol phosphatidyltransferase family protein [Candidatus Saccharicenans sp.]|jgi:phosphatidylglycerophosphate synthase|nr:CDP-alcohol phosphatidyltransferase family protein [Candidatus Saccharicenans sp.]MDH7493144.1 CDP-alcohol phosphatidyltransferase family protein [Candidatus Saccharicenans sp.]